MLVGFPTVVNIGEASPLRQLPRLTLRLFSDLLLSAFLCSSGPRGAEDLFEEEGCQSDQKMSWGLRSR